VRALTRSPRPNPFPVSCSIRLKAIDGDTDVPALADAIMRSCEIIPSSKQPVLVELLYELQLADTRSARPQGDAGGAGGAAGARAGGGSGGGGAAGSASGGSRAGSASGGGRSEGKEGDTGGGGGGGGGPPPPGGDDLPDARVDDVDAYLEALYEDDIAKKTEGARRILSLAQHSEHLLSLVENATLISALCRVLREDYKKSTTLTLAIMQVFLCVAQFRDLHSVLLGNRIGDMSMRILDLEQRRHTARMMDLERYSTLAMLQAKGDAAGEAAFRKVDAEARAREEEEEALAAGKGKGGGGESKTADDETEAGGRRKRRGKKGGDAAAAAAAAGEDGAATDGKAAEGGGGGAEEKRPIRLRPLPDGRVSISHERRKMFAAVRKCEGLTFACLSVLMLLAEELDVERKMCKKGIVGLLTPLLERDNTPLLLLAVNFLRKLSIFEENKDAMVAQGAGTKLVFLLPEPAVVPTLPPAGDPRTDLFVAILHLCFNLTFDATMCQAFVTSGILKKVGAMLRASPFRAIGLKLLYRLSTDVTVRGQFAGTDAIAYTLSMAIKFPQPRLPAELAALAMNIGMHQLTAEGMCKGDAVRSLVSRLAKTGDPAVAKLLRSLSQYTYGIQADSELKSHAMEDLKRELARNTAMLGAASAEASGAGKKGKKSKSGKGGSKKGSRKGGKGGAEDGKADDDDDGKRPDAGDDAGGAAAAAPAVGLGTGAAGTYIPEPDVPIPFDYPFDGLWAAVVKDLVRLVKGAESSAAHDVLVELLGLFGNLTLRDFPDTFPMAALTEDDDFLGVLVRKLNPAAGPEDDLLLEAVQVVSALALDAVSASALAASAVPQLLGEVLAERALADPDIAMQTVTCVARLLHHHETRDAIVRGSKIPLMLAELLAHQSERLAAEVDDCLYVMIEHDREFGTDGLWQQLQSRRFALYNREWLRAAESGSPGGGDHGGMRGGPGGHEDKHRGGVGGGGASLTEAPDAYVADDDYEAEPPAAEGEDGPHGAEQVGSPLHHMGRNGEAVAFDVAYLYQQARSGPEMRPLVSTRPGVGAPYDYEEDADSVGEDEGGDDDDDDGGDGEDELGDDVRELMDQYMGGGAGGGRGGAGAGARGMLAATAASSAARSAPGRGGSGPQPRPGAKDGGGGTPGAGWEEEDD
jgi:hypothetical protein